MTICLPPLIGRPRMARDDMPNEDNDMRTIEALSKRMAADTEHIGCLGVIPMMLLAVLKTFI